LVGVNNYGNIEVTSGIPQGCVHVDDEAARVAALKLGLEFAPAVTSFRKERGQLKPVARRDCHFLMGIILIYCYGDRMISLMVWLIYRFFDVF